MKELLSVLALGGGMAVVLSLFYSHVRHDWPVTYATISSSYDLFKTQVPGWHLLTRAIPVFVAACFTAHIAGILEISASYAVAVFALIHIALTSGRAAVEAFRFRNRRLLIVTYNVLLSLLLAFAAWLGLVLAPALENWFPSGPAIRDSIWVALIVVVVLKGIERTASLLNARDDNPAKRARRDIGAISEVWIRKTAISADADPNLVVAIVLTEALQRPRWIRSLERFKGRFFPKGTYGIAQAPSDYPISDQQSVAWLAAKLSGSLAAMKSCPADTQIDLAVAYFEQHNRDRDFVSQAADIYQSLPYEDLDRSQDMGSDGLPRIQVLDSRRIGFIWRIKGTFMPDLEAAPLTATSDERPGVVVQLTGPVGSRVSWDMEVPIATEQIILEAGSSRIEFYPKYTRSDM